MKLAIVLLPVRRSYGNFSLVAYATVLKDRLPKRPTHILETGLCKVPLVCTRSCEARLQREAVT